MGPHSRTNMNKTKLQLTQHRGNLRLWIESKALAAFFPADQIAVHYGARQVLIGPATKETMTNKLTRRSNGAAIIDINSAKLTASLGAKCTHVNVSPSNGALIIRPAK